MGKNPQGIQVDPGKPLVSGEGFFLPS
ncbi:Protein of unknown function [Thermobacillus xylanilyticus]|uniref:Uncharacterized protein n=1 Tax=Thermobacillus xylanilyticus TaxID=76633 RepID=A0ABM8V6I9_THEXY|nr:Protein of unknown function [Thermobacillus xylanilyticus]